MKKTLGISLALVMILGSLPLAIAEPLTQCKNSEHLLVLRSNGDNVCLSEKSAQRSVERLGWEIIEIVETLAHEISNEIVPLEEISNEESNIEKTEEPVSQERISWIRTATDLSYMDLEKIPNPEGYWVPIQDKDAFALALVNATGEEITNENKYGNADYFTTNGRINMHDTFGKSVVELSVSYRIYEVENVKSEAEQLPFINNFMNSMGFKLNGNTFSLTESFLETCEGNDFNRFCIIDEYSLSKGMDRDKIYYIIGGEGSKIKFTFYDKSYAYFHSHVIHIEFNGWTNHSELIQHPLDENIALEKAREFVLADEFLNKPHKVGDMLANMVANADICEAEIRANDDHLIIRQIVIAGVPFYETNIAKCTFPYTDGHWHQPLILVDGWTGEYVFRDYTGGLD